MKRYKILSIFLLMGGLLFAGTSCSQEEMDISSWEEPERIPISLSLSVAEMAAGTPETKAVMDPDIDNTLTVEEQISCFTVLQFTRTGNGSHILVAKDSYSGDDVPAILNGDQKITAIYSKGEEKSTFVVVANTLNVAGNVQSTTLEQFLASYSELRDYGQILTKIDGNDYFRMSGLAEDVHVDQSTQFEVELIRNVSKVTINVTNGTSGDEKVALEKVQLRGINAKYYYYTSLDWNKENDSYSAANPCRIDKGMDEFPSAGNDGSVQTFTYYVPANLRGTTDNQYQYTKGLDAPDGATRFCMYGTYGEGETQTSINYTYYLGGNLVNDFNLKPNHHYTYNITLSAKGDARYDYRVEDLAEVKFHVDANCYMVHPPKVGSRIYAIPIRRAATFWNKEGENGGVYGASQWAEKDYSAFTITPETEWTAVVLRSDFSVPGSFLKKSAGKGYDPTQPTQDPYLKIKVDAGMKGNAQIAVKVGDNIVWSWHIWITDYNPDQDLSPIQGQYLYDVEGGQVHRYNNTLFNRTEPTETTVGYKNGFIMDRGLGAWGTSVPDHRKAMYYEFGRKDPFWFPTDSHSKKAALETGEPSVTIQDLVIPHNIRYSVCHPTAYLTYLTDAKYQGWTAFYNGDDLTSEGNGWFDPKYYQHIGNQDVLEIKKSIYDPCPAGWKVPNERYASDIIGLNVATDWNTYSQQYSKLELPVGGLSGMYYNPEGASNKNKTGAIFFPFANLISGYGTGSQTDQRARYWSDCTSSNIIGQSYYYGFQSDYIQELGNIHTHAYNVRCVREYGPVVN